MTHVLLKPLTTEKSYAESLRTNTYIFVVPVSMNKQQIIAAVESQFSVSVVGIKTLIQDGKVKSVSKGRGRYPGKTVRSDIKKAYVTLSEGDKLAIFDSVKEGEEKK